MRTLQTDYLVVGAGAMGMAFTDALIDHADVHVTLVDRRHAAGGHWEDAYPFVRLHQASVFYGVASTVLGEGRLQQSGPEAGLQERALRSQIQAYYDDLLQHRFVDSGQVTFLGGSEHHTDGPEHLVTSLVSGETVRVDVRRRVVDATYLAPTVPATTPPPFGVTDDVPGRRRQRSRSPARGREHVRDRRVGQDRHRRHRLAAGPRGRPGPHHLGAAPRPLDAGPRRGAARSGGRARDWPRTPWVPRPRRRPSTTCSCASRPPAS